MRHRMSLFGLAAVAVVVMTAVTGTGVAAPATVTPPVVRTVTLTVSSSGSTLLATKGEQIVVKLSGRHLRWSAARAVQTTPVLEQVSGGVTTTSASRTVFEVVGYGTAGLVATGTPVCAAARVACPQFVVLWHVNVVVPVLDPPVPPVA